MARATPPPPPLRFGSQRSIACWQQRSAGSCADATNAVAHPLQWRMRVATALSRYERRRNQHCCPSVATAHRLLQQRSVRPRRTAARECSLLQQRITCCNSAQHGLCKRRNQQLFPSVATAHACRNSAPYHNAATCCNAAQPGVAQPNLLQRSTCCNAAQPVATDHSPLQPVAAVFTVQRVPQQSGPTQRSTICCNRP